MSKESIKGFDIFEFWKTKSDLNGNDIIPWWCNKSCFACGYNDYEMKEETYESF